TYTNRQQPHPQSPGRQAGLAFTPTYRKRQLPQPQCPGRQAGRAFTSTYTKRQTPPPQIPPASRLVTATDEIASSTRRK
ncbi:MAG TPA: hypothetical protein VJX67_13640, partial [Blastocatellia bacterium]|nr:hypothetical protein [Blastocatellia bacterium]